ncbi:MAG: ATP-binding protein, partial [Pseudomonadales bacterium]|nr:ATP-binding protein [Pseudomonadales bacterium]
NLELDGRTPTTVAPVNNLRQILVNLIKNASEALRGEPANGEDKRITVSTCGSVNFGGTIFVEVSVTDNGPGIPEEFREYLFQAQKSLKGGSHGGLGLSIARQLTDEMGGMITCRSRTSEEGTPGTTFQVLIPETINNIE